ncbi:hypothetical protein, partial [Salmonella enterica]|uniref:hypothetical protein n=1 Tax=Salmonella enterica TaxID=28901 RepID=UPI002FCDA688
TVLPYSSIQTRKLRQFLGSITAKAKPPASLAYFWVSQHGFTLLIHPDAKITPVSWIDHCKSQAARVSGIL